MRVANPGVWTLLAAVIALLIGVCVWGVFGRLDTFADTAVVSDGERSFCVVRSEYMDTWARARSWRRRASASPSHTWKAAAA